MRLLTSLLACFDCLAWALLTLSSCVCSFCVLQELLERCDEKTGGASKVSMEVMRSVLVTMQSEGKLGGTTGGGKGHGSQSTPNLTGGDRPKSSPNL